MYNREQNSPFRHIQINDIEFNSIKGITQNKKIIKFYRIIFTIQILIILCYYAFSVLI